MIRTKKSGFTIAEAMVVLALFTIVGAGAIIAMRGGQRHFERTVSNSIIDTKANRALNRVARRLTGAGHTTVSPIPDDRFGSTSMSFQEVVGWNAGTPIWSSDIEIRLEYEPSELNNGLDDDGDGLVDEGRVVQTENLGEADEISVVLVRGVCEYLEGETLNGADTNGNGLEDERGFCFALQGDEIIVRLSVMRLDPEGELATRTLETSVSLRN